jgi:hypothetical protein
MSQVRPPGLSLQSFGSFPVGGPSHEQKGTWKGSAQRQELILRQAFGGMLGAQSQGQDRPTGFPSQAFVQGRSGVGGQGEFQPQTIIAYAPRREHFFVFLDRMNGLQGSLFGLDQPPFAQVVFGQGQSGQGRALDAQTQIPAQGAPIVMEVNPSIKGLFGQFLEQILLVLVP